MCYFFFQSCIMLAFLVGFGVMPDWKYAPVMVFALVCDIVLSAALAVFLSAVTVYLRDVQHLIEVALVAGFFQRTDRLPVRHRWPQVGSARHLVGLLLQPPRLHRALLPAVHLRNGGAARHSVPARQLRGAVVSARARHRVRRLRVALRARDADIRQGRGQLREEL